MQWSCIPRFCIRIKWEKPQTIGWTQCMGHQIHDIVTVTPKYPLCFSQTSLKWSYHYYCSCHWIYEISMLKYSFSVSHRNRKKKWKFISQQFLHEMVYKRYWKVIVTCIHLTLRLLHLGEAISKNLYNKEKKKKNKWRYSHKILCAAK